MGKFEESRKVDNDYVQVIAGKKFNKHDEEKLLEINKKISQWMDEFREIIILHNKALDLIELHKFKEALNDFDKAILLYKQKKVTSENKDFALGTYVNLLNDKGIALSNSGENKKAISCYDEALKLAPTDKQVLNNKKRALEHLENAKS